MTDGEEPFTYEWKRDGQVVFGNTSSIVVNQTGNYSVKVTDSYGRYTTCYRSVEVDVTPPVITCPANVTVECDESIDPDNTGNATATDNANYNNNYNGNFNCGDPSPTITYNDTVVQGDCPENKTINRVWNATDYCGNSASCTQIITVQDTTPPVITCPANVTVEYDESTEPGNTGNANATDNCDPSPTITYNDTVKTEECTTIITRTWTATDNCGNSASCDQTITTNYESGLSVTKMANVTEVTAGDVIEYTIWVNNTGTVQLENVHVTDPFFSPPLDETIAALDPEQNVSYVRIYNVVEVDICEPIENTVTVEVDDPCAQEESLIKTSSVTVQTGYNPAISITKEANVTTVREGDVIGYNITVKNTGNVNLSDVEVADNITTFNIQIPLSQIPLFYTQIPNLSPGQSQSFYPNYTVGVDDICGPIKNNATVKAKDPCGNSIDPPATGSVAVETTYTALAELNITANVTEVEAGDVIGYTINVTNSGDVTLFNVSVEEDLTNQVWFIPVLPIGASELFYTSYPVSESDIGGPIVNNAKLFGAPPCVAAITELDRSVVVQTIGALSELSINKTANRKTVASGEEIEYTIEVCNIGPSTVHNVEVRDVFKRGYQQLTLISVTPGNETGRSSFIPEGSWTFDQIGAGSCVVITMVVKVEERQDFEFEMAQAVDGDGFVNLANDYSTTFQPYVIQNCAYASSDETLTVSDCEHVTVVADLGTELKTREHGSGTYESEEQVKVRTENKSIRMDKDVSATHSSTTLDLYNNRTVTYTSKWTEDACAKNRVTGASMHESYRYATRIDRESRMMLDKNESWMEVDSDFDGMGHIGFFKLADPNATSLKACPVLKVDEDYMGSFRIYERISEYGSSAEADKSASGEGFVNAKDCAGVGGCQRSYEYGTGSYESDQMIRTHTNYIAKDISLVYAPANLSLTEDVSIDQSLKWKEGMVSKWVAPNKSRGGGSLIGEEYTGIVYLDKETVASGLHEMNTEAEFSGKARYRVVVDDSAAGPQEVMTDMDDVYEGDYSIERRVLLQGVPHYDRPHMSIKKDGELVYLPEGTLAKYTIIVENDGNRELGIPEQPDEIRVRDIFPSGSKFVSASVAPEELTHSYATWNVTHLNIGDRSEIVLWLNVTEFRGDEVLNYVEALTEVDGNTIIANNVSSIEMDYLKCCPADPIFVTKTGQVDANASNVVWYKLEILNPANVPRMVKVSDTLPEGMRFLESSIPFSTYEGDVVTWNVIDIAPFETKALVYRTEALRSGQFVNKALVELYSAEGLTLRPRYAIAVVDVDEFEGEIPVPGWQPPDWDLKYPAEIICDEDCPLTP